MTHSTVRLTMAQALVRYLCNQFTEIDGERVPLFPGVFAIFGHGNVTCLSEALEAVQDTLPTWRGQNEQSMALAAIGFAKAKRRRQIMVAASSIGPGATNMVTAAGLAHSNRLPVLLLAGDTFANRRPDPVMQQVEHLREPDDHRERCLQGRSAATGTASRSPSRSSARCRRPWPRCSIPPIAARPSCRCARTPRRWPTTIPRPSSPRPCWSIPRPRPDRDAAGRGGRAAEVGEEAAHHLRRRRALLRGRRDRGAVRRSTHGIPIAETIAGKGAVTHDHPAHVGPIGILGSTSANALAAEADVVLAIGTRLMDFTTGSWTVFGHDARIIGINAARWDATKHRALAVVGDARETVAELDAALGGWKAPTRPGPRTPAS